MAHNQLRLDLIHRVHRYADDDQQAGAAEVEIHADAGCDPGACTGRRDADSHTHGKPINYTYTDAYTYSNGNCDTV